MIANSRAILAAIIFSACGASATAMAQEASTEACETQLDQMFADAAYRRSGETQMYFAYSVEGDPQETADALPLGTGVLVKTYDEGFRGDDVSREMIALNPESTTMLVSQERSALVYSPRLVSSVAEANVEIANACSVILDGLQMRVARALIVTPVD